MKFLTISKILLVLILPFLLFLAVLNFAAFDSKFYREKFSKYGVLNDVSGADSIHDKIISFIKGEDSRLPKELNDREKAHLADVRNIAKISRILPYILLVMSAFLFLLSAFILKVNNSIINFVGKALVSGGLLTIILAAALFFLISSDFANAFESFHRIFFEKGTYVFDPAKELLVRIYPEHLFMDLGIRISKYVIISSFIIISLGAFLIFMSKKQKG